MNFVVWKIALQNLLKYKSFTAVSLIGLTVGLAGFIIVVLFIRYEYSWDKTHDNYDRIYRVQRYYTKVAFAHDGTDISPHTHSKTAFLLEKHPEFEKVTAIREEGGKFLSTNLENQVYDETGIVADHNFLDVFTYQFIEGAQQNCLTEPYSLILSRSMAEKLFTDEKAIGQTVIYEKKLDFKVTGVYEDLPRNSTVRPAYILSLSTLKSTDNIVRDESWAGNFMTYALLKHGADVAETEAKIKNVYAEFKGRELEELELCPLSKIYLSFNGRNDYLIVLAIFGIIGLFILTMSVFNYMNFTIATASTRGKEIAVRKISGAERTSLVTQLQSETLLLTIISAAIALITVKQLLPMYNTFVNSGVTLNLEKDWKIIALLLLASVFIGLITGIYPARVISTRNVIKLVKEGVFSNAGSRFDIKKILVILQFTISIFLICLTLFFMVQINHMLKIDLGFDRNNLLYTKLSTEQPDLNFNQLRGRLLQHPEILNASMSSNLPFVNMQGGMLNWEGSDPDEKILYRPNRVSYDFVENMDLKIKKGRNFSEEFPADIENSCIVNEAALRCFGWDDPIGKKINDKRWTIIGVVEDYNLYDIHNQIDPAVLLLSDGKLDGDLVFAFRYSTGNLENVRQILTSEYDIIFPNDPFEFHPIETAIINENSFKIYQTIKKSISFFSVFVILLAIIALLSMVSYSISRRTKEIGIRKINGSSVQKLFLLLNRDYLYLLGISLLFALPLAYITYNFLPGNFKVPLPVWVPFLSALIILMIIIATTGYQTLKAVRRNPVEALRYE
jgi:putative ABC transport system permease protein